MPKTIHSRERKVILNIHTYLSERKTEGLDSIRLNNITNLTVNMTVMKIVKEGQISTRFSTPKKLQAKIKKENLNELDLYAVRHKIQEFYTVRKEVPSIKRLLVAHKEDVHFNGGREPLRLILQKLGYHYKEMQESKKYPERFDIMAWMDKYLLYSGQIRYGMFNNKALPSNH